MSIATATAQTPRVAVAGANPAAVTPAGAGFEIVSRAADGQVTLRATRINQPILLDGRLDDEVYQQVPAAGDFIQQEPREGQLATEKTDMWVFFDDRNIYVTGRCWESEPGLQVAKEFRRDHRDIQDGDNFTIVLDTFYDRRNGVYFQTNPLGGLRDMQVSDERQTNPDWNAVWDARTTRDDKGWTVEVAIPLKSLRYKTSGAQVWGINARRIVRWKNEVSYLTRIPAGWGTRGILKFSSAATLVGIELPKAGGNIEVKPYATSGILTDALAQPTPLTGDFQGDVGVDAKYGLTKSLNADFTVNTDFAQVENDETQVNFGRASVFVPEKRDFFLEGQGIFAFGGVSARPPGGDGGGTLSADSPAPNLSPIVFYSRSIGFSSGFAVPIVAGARVTGRAGKYSLGLLNIQTDELEQANAVSTNYSVVRVRRDLFQRSSVGFIGTYRPQRSGGRPGSNEVFGADMTLSFLQNLTINSYFVKSSTPGVTVDETSYLVKMDNVVDRWAVNFERLKVGAGFNPEIGFVRRTAFARTFGQFQFSPRPENSNVIRKLFYRANIDYLQNPSGKLESAETAGTFRIDFSNGDQFESEVAKNYEYLEEPLTFAVAAGERVAVVPGEYSFSEYRGIYYVAPQRPISGRVSVIYGTFYDGTRTELGFNGRFNLGARIGLEPRIQYDWINLPGDRFTTKLIGTRVGLTINPRTSISSLIQYSSSGSSFSQNVRFRWEYRPGSDLYVVYSDNRDTRNTGFPELQNKSLVVKATRLMRW